MRTAKISINWSAGHRPGPFPKRFPMAALIFCALFLHGIIQADPANNGNASAAAPASGTAKAVQPPVVPSQPFSSIPKSASASVPTVGQPLSASFGKSTKPVPGSLQNPANPATQRSVIQPAGPLLTKAPDHGRAPAIVGGPAATKTKTTAAVTGTGLNRKP
jgi:hypothetical protein